MPLSPVERARVIEHASVRWRDSGTAMYAVLPRHEEPLFSSLDRKYYAELKAEAEQIRNGGK